MSTRCLDVLWDIEIGPMWSAEIIDFLRIFIIIPSTTQEGLTHCGLYHNNPDLGQY